jgi:membrane associated rhomboid family serine protease
VQFTPPSVSVPPWLPLQQLVVVAVVVASLAIVRYVDGPGGGWGRRLRRRLLAGVPWGTLVVCAVVLAFYLFVQGGFDHWYSPVVIPYRAWSYFYPLGVLTAGLAHGGPGHLLGNLVGTLVFAPIAEYAWGHFPTRRGSASFSSWRTNPYVRAFVLFPAVVLVVSVLLSAFAIGPVIGFSGVVFAFAGVALVRYPLTTILALVAGRVLGLLRAALQTPTLEAKAQPTFSTPWWAEVAIQGHALGLFVGVVLGVWLLRRRGDALPSATRTWAGVLLFAVSQSLWAVYWFRGGETFVLFRALGVVLVFVLATLVALTVAASDRPLIARAVSDGGDADGGDSDRDDGAPGLDTGLLALPRWEWGIVLMILAASALAGPAVPVNLLTTSDDALPGDPVQVRDYEMTYAEDVTDGMVAAVDVSAFGETTAVNTSGVIVRNDDRGIWTTAVSKGRLAFAGRTVVRVGGVGWRDAVVVERTGWTVTGGGVAYRVNATHDGETRTLYRSPSAQASPIVGGRNVSIAPRSTDFLVNVSRNNESVRAPVPPMNESVRLDGVTLERTQQGLVAHYGETRVLVAKPETYPGQRTQG